MKIRDLIYIAVLCSALLLSGCNLENLPSEDTPAVSSDPDSSPPQPVSSATSSTPPPEPLQPDEVIPAAVQTPRIEGDRLSYSVENIWCSGEYYTVEISGIRLPQTSEAPELETTYINGELYGDFRLDLFKDKELIDTLKINVPRSDRFLIFESVLQDLTYGCEIISNMRDFDAAEYPDLIQLDFHITSEAEVPQYARFFTISDDRLTEIPVYENGAETAPYGTHIEPRSAGLMIQHVVAKEYGSYTVKQYEYTFDPKTLSITRQRVRYTGYDI